MIYFTLNNDGLLYNLGDHGDYESAEYTAQDMQLDSIWLFDDHEFDKWYSDYMEMLNQKHAEPTEEDKP